MTVNSQLIYERDGQRCCHCGHRADSIQHRANRQMGGAKNPVRHSPSNLLAMCWISNLGAESDSEFARLAKRYGWKLTQDQNPLEVPVYDVTDDCWYELGNDYSKTPTTAPEES